MQTEVHLSQQDIENLAAKLDRFAPALTGREQHILLALFELAGEAIRGSTTGKTAATGPDTSDLDSLPSLSGGFREAFGDSLGSTFRFASGDVSPDLVDSTGAWTKIMHLS